jgi:hypothetical protein
LQKGGNIVGKPEGKRPPGVDGKIILEWISGKQYGKVHLAQDYDQWQALANTLIDLQFHGK